MQMAVLLVEGARQWRTPVKVLRVRGNFIWGFSLVSGFDTFTPIKTPTQNCSGCKFGSTRVGPNGGVGFHL